MCSIIGYVTEKSVSPILVNSLKRMEYRGYDSVGIATNLDHHITIKKGIGKVSDVNDKIQLDLLQGSIGIGHTRWATHGGVTQNNAHPHLSADGSVAIVHNGIIENYLDLKKELEDKGISFQSKTDTEVIPNLLSLYYAQTNDVKKTIILTTQRLRGNYAFVALFSNDILAAVRYHEPLIIGLENDGGYFISSDILGFADTDNVIYLENEQFVIIDKSDMKIYDFQGESITYDTVKMPKNVISAEKGNHSHYTIKEISEQIHAIPDAIQKSDNEINDFVGIIKNIKNLYFCGSGTSYHVALLAKYLLPKFTGKTVEPIMASESNFLSSLILPDSAFVAISQSGESADVLEATEMARNKNAEVLSIVNSMTSTLAHESEITIPLNCGPEIGVAASKSFTSQLAILYKITDILSNGKITFDFKMLSHAVKQLLEYKNNIQELAKKLKHTSSIYILGRGIHYSIAKEGALKIKELAYIHAEGIAAGELKHGPLALMNESAYVIVINPVDEYFEMNLNSISQIKARGAKIIGISDEPNDLYDEFIKIPKISPSILYPIIEVIPFQLLAYYLAVEMGEDPDHPRHLAKSVTVR